MSLVYMHGGRPWFRWKLGALMIDHVGASTIENKVDMVFAIWWHGNEKIRIVTARNIR